MRTDADCGPTRRTPRRRAASSVAVVVLLWLGAATPHLAGTDAGAPPEAAPAGDFSRFDHRAAQHARLPCLLCHRRKTDSTTPTLPGHDPCAGCHAQQLADPASPICRICHENPQDGHVRPFPALRTFGTAFDHRSHVRGAPGARCVACHRQGGRSDAPSTPRGRSAHAACYACHAPRAQASGRDISSCGVCHRIGEPSFGPTSNRARRVGFSHGAHVRTGLACDGCHALRGGPPARQVTSPIPAQHHAPQGARSCASCHDGRRAFGGDDFSVCVRCHRGDTWHF